MRTSRRIQVVLHLCAGGALALAAVLADDIFGRAAGWGPRQLAVLAAGLVMLLLGFSRPGGMVARVSTHLSVSMLSLFLCFGIIEGLVRITGFQVWQEEEAWRQIPTFYRVATEPTGTVFFRRPGPDRWTGQVLSTQAAHLGITPRLYPNEQVITVEYDRRGFRNRDDLSAWEIAVAGDSYTEAGYLPHEQLFTSLLAERLRVRVLNLGVSGTGPLTHLHYLEEYGISPSTRRAVIVFFEGNDLADMALEYDALERWKATSRREYRQFRNASFLRPLYVLGRKVVDEWPRRQADLPVAYFVSPEGRRRVDLTNAPPATGELPPETRRQLDDFLRNYSEFGQRRGVEVWLAYLPDPHRVLHGELEFTAHAPAELRAWKPTDLPDGVAALCARYGIRFVDLTPALIRRTRGSRRLTYNPVYYLHLNADGSRVVAEELARHFSVVMGMSGPTAAGPDIRAAASR